MVVEPEDPDDSGKEGQSDEPHSQPEQVNGLRSLIYIGLLLVYHVSGMPTRRESPSIKSI